MNNEILVINPHQLNGVVRVSGAKNSALRLLAATILTAEPVYLRNFPVQLLDVKVHLDMLAQLGKAVKIHSESELTVSEDRSPASRLEWKGRSIRNTLLILGALVARTGSGAVPLPGGCDLGDRKHDIHEYVLRTLGATVRTEGGYLIAEAPAGLVGAEIHLPIRSTGATENAILAASLAVGTTRIWNPHVRPEIIDLISLLNKMGSNIRVFGQEHIEVQGVAKLQGAQHSVIPDNMEAITWLAAATISGGNVEIQGFPKADLEVVLSHLVSSGANIFFGTDSVVVKGGACYPIEVSTGPHPGINSDIQPILAAWAAHARGDSRIVDLRFPGRYQYVQEMAKMGVSYSITGDMLQIHGTGNALVGTDVCALDLRAGAALALCALAAKGSTRISNAWQIDRGYERFVEKLTSLGASAYYE